MAKVYVKVKVAQSYPTHCNPINCSPPGSSVHRILPARTLECVAVPFSRGFSQLRDQSQVSCIAGRFFTIRATREYVCMYLSVHHLFIYLSAHQSIIYLWINLWISPSICHLSGFGFLPWGLWPHSLPLRAPHSPLPLWISWQDPPSHISGGILLSPEVHALRVQCSRSWCPKNHRRQDATQPSHGFEARAKSITEILCKNSFVKTLTERSPFKAQELLCSLPAPAGPLAPLTVHNCLTQRWGRGESNDNVSLFVGFSRVTLVYFCLKQKIEYKAILRFRIQKVTDCVLAQNMSQSKRWLCTGSVWLNYKTSLSSGASFLE